MINNNNDDNNKNVISELNSIEDACLSLMHQGWMEKQALDQLLKRVGETPSSLQRRLKAVGFELFIITTPVNLNPVSSRNEWYVVLPQKGQNLSDEEVATLTLFIGTVLLKERPLTRLEMQAIFGSKFSRTLRQLMQKKMIIAINETSSTDGYYTFSPAAKAIFRENFEKIPMILKELIAFSSQPPS